MTPSTALRLAGADALALLHRVSTQRLDDLAAGTVRATLFCDFRGRLLHRAVVAVAADGAVWLLRDDAPGDPLAAFLDRHVFRDDVRIEDRSADLPVRALPGDAGPAAGALVERDGVPAELRVADGEGYRVGGAPAEEDPAVPARRRVLAGRPGHGHEIVEAFTPFEVGLAHEVHLDKGCFTGQEALMRLVTYRSVRRRLARVDGAGSAPAVPADLSAGGAAAGVLTSAVEGADGWTGLAVLRNEVCDPPRALAGPDGMPLAPPRPLPPTRPRGRG